MDEHVTVAHDGPRTVGGAVPVPNEGDPTEALRGLEQSLRQGLTQRTELPIEEARQAVKNGEIEAPTLNVREQHMAIGGTALPHKVRVYDKQGYQRFVRPEIAVDRVLLKDWSWPEPGEAEGHRKDDSWYTWGPCKICGRETESNHPMGAAESLISHQRIDHPSWWKVHQADQERETAEVAGKALTKLVELETARAERELNAETAGSAQSTG